jgi:quercetin dioxygenase-like cupin family protein
MSDPLAKPEVHAMQRCILLAAMCIPTLALAQTPIEPAAMARTFQDPTLEWGPCPEFLPEGCAIAVLHGDPSQDNADIFFRVPAGSSVPRHWHTSPERMVLVSGELHVTYDGHDTIVLETGAYAYGPARLPHSASCVSEQPCVLAIAFESPVDAVAVEDAANAD